MMDSRSTVELSIIVPVGMRHADAVELHGEYKASLDTLVQSALKGKGAMAAQGGGEFSDFEISRAVVYMANKGGAKFDEPKPPAAPASAASAAD